MRRAPGGRPRYSNLGFGLLGHVLALRAGCSYEQLVHTRICRPLALEDTGVSVPADAGERFAQGHKPAGPAGAALGPVRAGRRGRAAFDCR